MVRGPGGSWVGCCADRVIREPSDTRAGWYAGRCYKRRAVRRPSGTRIGWYAGRVVRGPCAALTGCYAGRMVRGPDAALTECYADRVVTHPKLSSQALGACPSPQALEDSSQPHKIGPTAPPAISGRWSSSKTQAPAPTARCRTQGAGARLGASEHPGKFDLRLPS